MMATMHSMPVFWAEFFADTERVSDDAAKAYIFLLGHAWLQGAKLPDDDAVLARLARVSRNKWNAIKTEVLSFWIKLDDGSLTQKRLRKEWDWCEGNERLFEKRGPRAA